MDADEQDRGEPPDQAGDAEYKVGPGRPPREHQFRKGQSGNPGGRPKGVSVTAELRRLMGSEHNGKSMAELVAERMLKDALSGKSGAVKELLDRTEGKVVDKTQIEGHVGGITVLNIPPPKVIGDPDIDAANAAERRRVIDEAKAQAPPGTKLVVGDWPLKV